MLKSLTNLGGRLRTLATKAKAERKAEKKAARILKFKHELQEEEVQAFRGGKILPHDHDATRSLVERAVSGHRAASGKPLFAIERDSRRSVAKQLWDAPIACMVVGGGVAGGAAGGAAEPRFLYANLLACEAHGAASFTELIGTRSGLPGVLPGGKAFESNYRKKVAHGTRGREATPLPNIGETTVLGATRWAVPPDDPPTELANAVAYAFTHWLREDGTLHGPRGFRVSAPLTAEARGSIEAATEAAVLEVRRLKGDEGRGNKDAAVMAAVAEMKRCRGQLVVDDENVAARERIGV